MTCTETLTLVPGTTTKQCMACFVAGVGSPGCTTCGHTGRVSVPDPAPAWTPPASVGGQSWETWMSQ